MPIRFESASAAFEKAAEERTYPSAAAAQTHATGLVAVGLAMLACAVREGLSEVAGALNGVLDRPRDDQVSAALVAKVAVRAEQLLREAEEEVRDQRKAGEPRAEIKRSDAEEAEPT